MFTIIATADFNPSVIVAITLVGFLCMIMIVAMIKYSAESAMKIWGVVGPILTLVIGMFGTYFFKQGEVEEAKTQAIENGTELRKARYVVNQLRDDVAIMNDIGFKIEVLPELETIPPPSEPIAGLDVITTE